MVPAGSVRRCRNDVDPAAVAIEQHIAINQRKNRVVPAEADITTWQKFCSALTDEDVAGDDGLPAKFFDAESFALAIASVFDTALTFFMSHNLRRVERKLGLGRDGRDFEFGELTPVAHGAVVTFAPFVFESDDLRGFVLVNDFRGDRCAAHIRSTDADAGILRNEKDFREAGRGSGFEVKFFDVKNVAFGNPILFAACVNYCVCHKIKCFFE